MSLQDIAILASFGLFAILYIVRAFKEIIEDNRKNTIRLITDEFAPYLNTCVNSRLPVNLTASVINKISGLDIISIKLLYAQKFGELNPDCLEKINSLKHIALQNNILTPCPTSYFWNLNTTYELYNINFKGLLAFEKDYYTVDVVITEKYLYLLHGINWNRDSKVDNWIEYVGMGTGVLGFLLGGKPSSINSLISTGVSAVKSAKGKDLINEHEMISSITRSFSDSKSFIFPISLLNLDTVYFEEKNATIGIREEDFAFDLRILKDMDSFDEDFEAERDLILILHAVKLINHLNFDSNSIVLSS